MSNTNKDKRLAISICIGITINTYETWDRTKLFLVANDRTVIISNPKTMETLKEELGKIEMQIENAMTKDDR